MGYLSGVAIKRRPGSSEAQWNLFSGINAPTSQSLLNYILLALVYGGILIHRRQPLTTKWYYYLILGIIDVEANYIEGPKPLKGDLLVILGSMLYAYGNVTEEYLVKKNNRIELMAMLGVFGAVVSGIQMYLPRHQFGSLQGKMFPAYFMLMSVCSAISVAAFAYLHPWKTASTIERYQLGFLMAALGLDLSNLLVFTPMTIEKQEKYKDVPPSAIDIFKDTHCSNKSGFSENVQDAIAQMEAIIAGRGSE